MPKIPWIVRIHYRFRTLSFALLFVATALQLFDKNFSIGLWALLAALLLMYPHLQYRRVCRAPDPVKAEMDNLVVDSILLGFYAALVAFSPWLSFSAMLGTLINAAANKGWRGVGATLAALAGGAFGGALFFGFQFVAEANWPSSVFCVAALSAYLLAVGNLGYTRNLHLRSIREALKAREKELLAANEALQKTLDEVSGLQHQLHEQAIHDPLTGLYNRRYLDTTLERELARCKREGQALSLMMIDIDHFKRVNDTYGHQAGDEVLKRLGERLVSMARAEDVACRYGGEEFLLIMPTMSLVSARSRAEALRTAFGSTTVVFGSFRLQVTLSIGISVYPGNGTTVGDLISGADRALYEAKQGGRNQVRVAPEAQSVLFSGDSAKLLQLVWRQSYESGHALIDHQHKDLFTQINALLEALLADRPRSEMAQLIAVLIESVVEHFRHEEALIAASGFPDADEHAAIHAGITDRASQLVERWHSGECDFGALFQFLAHEVVARHMLGADRVFFSYLGGRAAENDSSAPNLDNDDTPPVAAA